MPTDATGKKKLAFYLDTQMYKDVKKEAIDQGVSVTAMVTRLLEEELEKGGEKE